MIWSLKAPAAAPAGNRRPGGWIAPIAAAVATAALILGSVFAPASHPETPSHNGEVQAASAAGDRSLGAR